MSTSSCSEHGGGGLRLTKNQKRKQRQRNQLKALQQQVQQLQQQLQQQHRPVSTLPFDSYSHYDTFPYYSSSNSEHSSCSNHSEDLEENEESQQSEHSDNDKQSCSSHESNIDAEEDELNELTKQQLSIHDDDDEEAQEEHEEVIDGNNISTVSEDDDEDDWVELNLFVLAQHYHFIRRVTSSRDAAIFKVRELHGERVFALKMSRIEFIKSPEKIPMEVRILARAQPHPNIVQLIGWHYLERTRTSAFVMEWLNAAEPEQPEEIQQYIASTLNAVQHLHQCGILYRDIKPSNVIWIPEEKQVKVIDFDCATEYQADKLHRSIVGTVDLYAPEILGIRHAKRRQLPLPRKGYGLPVDVWGVGCLLALLLCQVSEEEICGGERTLEDVLEQLKDRYDDDQDAPEYDLLNRLLQPVPELRISIEDALQHPYFHNM